MPTYSFRNKETGEEFEDFMSISAFDQYLLDNPHIESFPTGAPPTLDPVRLGRIKPDEGFRDVLRNMKHQQRGTTINTF